nr:DNA methylase [uncultured organism]
MLTVITTKIDSLTPFPNNPRSHSKKQVLLIANYIAEFGFCNPILIDAGYNIIAGHGRYLAGLHLGLSEIPTIMLQGLAPEQARALRIADNKIALNSSWDDDLLRAELGELSALDLSFDLEVTGFSVGELNVILAGDADPDDEIVPAAPMSPVTVPGDIWEFGDRHRIGCGDARDEAFVRKVIGTDEAIACAFLDVPYNVRIKGHANVKRAHREFAMASGEMNSTEFQNLLKEALSVAASVSRDGSVHFICMDWRHQTELLEAGRETYDSLLNMCVWNKSNAGMGSLYRSKHELVYVYKVGTGAHLNTVELGRHGRNRTNVWDYASVNTFKGTRSADLALHPTVKPVGLVADAIKDVSRRGELVLDTFLGSGTTLLACEREGRRCRGIDIDPAYIDIAIERWSSMTGKAPRKVEAVAKGWAA